MTKIVDMTGIRYGSLVALRRTGERNKAKNLLWEFVCDCGRRCVKDGYAVRRGLRSRCDECSALLAGKQSIKHGRSRTPEFAIWIGIHTRCYNKDSSSYRNYGARGITICKRWRRSFENFLDDMGPRPFGTSLDRIDNNGQYSPCNCRWATTLEQSLNRRTNVYLVRDGIQLTAAEWADKAGLPRTALYARIKRGDAGEHLFRPLRLSITMRVIA